MLSTSQSQVAAAPPMRAGWRVKAWAFETSLSVASVNKLIAAKKIRSVKYGAARIILTSPAEYLATLPSE
jgi:hypothetical protein